MESLLAFLLQWVFLAGVVALVYAAIQYDRRKAQKAVESEKPKTTDQGFGYRKAKLSTTEALAKIGTFSFDEPGVPRPFSKRLAEEQNWTPEKTALVIDEYRKFLVLLVSSDHNVSPSKDIDQAWHLHILYTDSYFNKLCRDRVGFVIHHFPSNGSKPDESKYAQAYLETLHSYWKLWGTVPPAAVWGPTPQAFWNRIASNQKPGNGDTKGSSTTESSSNHGACRSGPSNGSKCGGAPTGGGTACQGGGGGGCAGGGCGGGCGPM